MTSSSAGGNGGGNDDCGNGNGGGLFCMFLLHLFSVDFCAQNLSDTVLGLQVDIACAKLLMIANLVLQAIFQSAHFSTDEVEKFPVGPILLKHV